MYSVKDNATTMELMWVLKCVKSHFSFASCEDLKTIFTYMFPDQCCGSCGKDVVSVPAEFSLGPTKAAYLLTEALAPYFQQELVKDIGSAFFTLEYDETTNEAGAKELQIKVRYFSDNHGRVMTHHLRTFFMGSAKADQIVRKLDLAIMENSLSCSKLLKLECDGPNVNKSVKKKFSDDVAALRGKPLIDYGSCQIHVVHGAYEMGLKKFGMNASDFLFDVHRFFKDWPKRRENFEEIQAKLNAAKRLKENKDGKTVEEPAPIVRFIKHVPTR